MTNLIPNRPVSDDDLAGLEVEVAVCRRCGGFGLVTEDLTHYSQKCVGRREREAIAVITLVPQNGSTADA